jgi:hypothetical protein
MPHKLLTKLKTGCGLADPNAGSWLGDDAQRDFLSRFADGVETADGVNLSDVHSVPSVFAQPILFSQALGDRNHPSHKDVVDQWRGLLAIFALQPWEGYSIAYRLYPISPPPPGAHTTVGNVPRDGLHLNAMLHSMLPAPQGLWNPLRLILCDDFMVGAISPWTMAFTPASPCAPPSVPWVTEGTGKLRDPISLFGEQGQPSVELTLLHQWIGCVMAAAVPGAATLPGVPGIFYANVLARLGEWQNDLAPYLDAQIPVAVNALQTPDPAAGPVGMYFRPATNTVVPGVGQIGDTWLAPTRTLKARVMVLKRQGMSPLTRLDNEAFPFNVDLEKLPGAEGHSFSTRAKRLHNVDWIFADELFFPEKLTYVNLTSQAWATDPDAAHYSVPLTRHFFRFFNHADIAKLLSVDISGTGNNRTLTATLDLPLQGGPSFQIQKKYSLATDRLAKTGDVTPGFVLWPDFYSESWPHSLAGYRGPKDQPRFRVAPLYAGGKVDAFSRVFDPANAGAGPENEIRVWECPSAPLGFALEENGESAGLVLRKAAVLPRNIVAGTQWRVAVDFGTANTMISYEDTGIPTAASPLTIQPRLLQLNESPQAENLKNAVAPPKEVSSPFKTLCYERDITVITPAGPRAGSIYSPGSDFLYGDSNIRSLVPNLKWGGNEAALGDYLKSLVRLIMTEARAAGVANVFIKWTYPLSLATPSKNAMQNFWDTLGGRFNGGGVNVVVGDPRNQLEHSLSESEAASRALARFPGSTVPAAARGLCIVVDVGGGSTDFAFWSNAHLLDYISCKLAANDVLRGDWLNPYPNFMNDIYGLSTGGVQPATEAMPRTRTPSRNLWEMWINSVLSFAKYNNGTFFDDSMGWMNHPAVQRIFGDQRAQEPWILSIRTSAYLLLAGLCYFAGLRAREYAPVLGNDDVRLVLTGRGSSLCGWISNNAQGLTNVLRDCFARGYQRERRGEPLPSVTVLGAALGSPNLPCLKAEVGWGALQEAIGDGANVAPPSKVPVFGEINWRYSGNVGGVEWNKHLTRDEMATLLPPNEVNGVDCYIQELLALCRMHRGNLNLDSRLDSLVVDWANVTHLVTLDLRDNQITQPAFAMELKALMNTYFDLCAAMPADAAGTAAS